MSAASVFRSLVPLNFMSFALHRFKKRVAVVVSYITDWALFIGVVLLLGVGSSWYMIEKGSSLTTVTAGPWTSWIASGRTNADPYTRAHEARTGILAFNADVMPTFIAREDFDGRTLHSSCTYEIEGREAPNFWWSLTVFDADGRLISNVLNRSTFTSDTMAINPDGTYKVVLSRDPHPGNWLPTGGAGRLALQFSVLDLGTRSVAQDGEIERMAPLITRKGC